VVGYAEMKLAGPQHQYAERSSSSSSSCCSSGGTVRATVYDTVSNGGLIFLALPARRS